MENLNLDEIEKYNPLTDTGKVLKQLLIEKIHERESLDELVKLTREQVEREKTLDGEKQKIGAAIKRVWRAVLAAVKDLEQ